MGRVRHPTRVLAALAVSVAVSGCAPTAPRATAAIDPFGTWVTSPGEAGAPPANPPFPRFRLVLNAGYVLNPLGPDCAGTPTFSFQPPVMVADLFASRHLPSSWIGPLAGGTDMARVVVVACDTRPILRLSLLGPEVALMDLDDGAVLVLYKTMLRPG